MRAVLPVLAIGLTASSAPPIARGDVRARPSVAVTWAVPAYRSLPEGSVLPIPNARPPLLIPAGETLAEFQVATPKAISPKAGFDRHCHDAKRPSGPMATRNATAVLSAGGAATEGEEGPAVCFADSRSAPGASPDEADENAPEQLRPAVGLGPNDWPEEASSVQNISFALDRPGDSVRAIHAERFVRQAGGHATLDVTDAWVDVQTTGVRPIVHYALPLARVMVGPNGLEVYAARDKRAVQVVVARDVTRSGVQTPEIAARVRAELPALEARLSGGSEARSDCRHLRFALRTASGAGQMATLQSLALLPPRQPTEPAGPDASAEERASLAVSAMRRRPFQLSVSATQALSDAEPAVSLSMGWTGREQPGEVEPVDGL